MAKKDYYYEKCNNCGLSFITKIDFDKHKADKKIYAEGKIACDYFNEKYDGDINRDSAKLVSKLNKKLRSQCNGKLM